jgi:hypothetical protein
VVLLETNRVSRGCTDDFVHDYVDFFAGRSRSVKVPLEVGFLQDLFNIFSCLLSSLTDLQS